MKNSVLLVESHCYDSKHRELKITVMQIAMITVDVQNIFISYQRLETMMEIS